MPRKTYIVKAGDTLDNISRVFYGVPNRTEDIIRENAFLQHRQTNGAAYANGVPFLEEGDVISVNVEPGADVAGTLSVLAGEENTPTMHLNGIKEPMPNGTSLTLRYDACANTVQTRFTWDPDDPLDRDRWGSPTNLPDVDIYYGPSLIFGGRFESIRYSLDPTDRSVSLKGRTHTGVLIKSNIPFGAYPLERKKENLNQILSWLCGVWSINVEGTPGNNEPFKKVSFESSQTASEAVLDLAIQRSSVVQPDETGRVLRIVTPEITEPLEYLDYGVDSFKFGGKEYDTTQIHDIHQGISETAKNVNDRKDLTLGYLGDWSVKHHSLENQSESTSAEYLQFLAYKSFREYFTIPIVVPGFLNTEGKLYNVGDVIAVRCSGMAIYSFRNLLVKTITYDFDKTNPTVTLMCIPPQVYLASFPG